MDRKKISGKRTSRGQVMSEYVLMICCCIGLVLALYLLLAVFMGYGWRIMALIGWESTSI